jgi:hypothetical protein
MEKSSLPIHTIPNRKRRHKMTKTPTFYDDYGRRPDLERYNHTQQTSDEDVPGEFAQGVDSSSGVLRRAPTAQERKAMSKEITDRLQ